MPDSALTVMGNLTRDPEIKFLPSGAAKCEFAMAVNRRWQNRKTQEWEEEVSFFDVLCWGDLGTNVADTLKKGSRAIVSGRLEQQRWKNDADESRSRIQIVADDVAPSLKWATVEISTTTRDTGQVSDKAPEQTPPEEDVFG